MIKRYGLGWLDLEVSLAADLTFSAIKIINEEKKEEIDRYLFDVYLQLQQTHAIKTIFSKNNDRFMSFEEFKAPKNFEVEEIKETDKQRMKKEAERIKNKFGG